MTATQPKLTPVVWQAFCACGYLSPVVADPETLPAKCANGCPPRRES